MGAQQASDRDRPTPTLLAIFTPVIITVIITIVVIVIVIVIIVVIINLSDVALTATDTVFVTSKRINLDRREEFLMSRLERGEDRRESTIIRFDPFYQAPPQLFSYNFYFFVAQRQNFSFPV